MENGHFQELVLKNLMHLTEDVKSIKGDVSSLKGDVSSLKGDVSSLKGDVKRIETRMESEVIDKIRVLFDGHQQHSERLDRIEQKVDAIFEQVGVHEVQIKLIKKAVE